MHTYLLSPNGLDQLLSLIQWVELPIEIDIEERTCKFISNTLDNKVFLPIGEYCDIGESSRIFPNLPFLKIEDLYQDEDVED